MKRILAPLFAAVLLLVSMSACGGGGGSDPTFPAQQTDTSKPAVNSTTPAQNSVDVGISSDIMVTFNEAINPATINVQTFFLMKDGATPVTGTVTYVGTAALFRPDSSLSTGASYTATVTTGVKDLAGNAMAANYSWQFTTGAVSDITPPTVLATFPAANSVNAALNSSISVTFNKPIDPVTINAQTFILMKDGAPVTGTVTFVGTTAEFRPTSNLLAGSSYTATVTTGVKDLAGNALATNFSWGFTTGSASSLDTVGPQVLSVFPLDGAQNVPVGSAFVVSFNEPILPFEFGLFEGRPVAVTFNDTYTTVTMKPTVAMAYNTTYTSSLRVRDMAGNLMSAAFTWTFSTVPQ